MSSAVSECGGRGQLAGPQLYSRIPGGERGKMVMMMVVVMVMMMVVMVIVVVMVAPNYTEYNLHLQEC